MARELPNTGTTESITAMVAAAASAILGFGLIARRRKEDEEELIRKSATILLKVANSSFRAKWVMLFLKLS